MSIYCLNCWCARAFCNIWKNNFNKKFLKLSLECTVNSAGRSGTFDFFGTLSIINEYRNSEFHLIIQNVCVVRLAVNNKIKCNSISGPVGGNLRITVCHGGPCIGVSVFCIIHSPLLMMHNFSYPFYILWLLYIYVIQENWVTVSGGKKFS